MIPLSFSGMQDLQCPYRFRVLRIDKSYKEPETEAMRVGAVVADILARYRRHCYSRGMSSDLSFFDAIEDSQTDVLSMIRAFKESQFAVVPLDAERPYVESFPAISTNTAMGGFAFDQDLKYLGFDKKAWLHPSVAFRCKMDFCFTLDDDLYIVDDKTGWGDGDDQQLAIYALLGNIVFPGSSRISCHFNNIAKRTTTSIEFSPEDIEPMRQVLLQAMSEVNERDDWPAVACSKCAWCTVPGCPIREGTNRALVEHKDSPLVEIPSAITTRQDAENALLFVEFANRITGRVKQLLEEYVSNNGPVRAAGKVAQFTGKEEWKPKDLSSLCAALVQFGAPKELVWKQLSLTKAALEKIIKKAKLEAKQPWIDAYLEKSTSKKFGITKDKTY